MAMNTHGKSLLNGSTCRNPAIGGKVRGSGSVLKGSKVRIMAFMVIVVIIVIVVIMIIVVILVILMKFIKGLI
jgi:hypothetical protein